MLSAGTFNFIAFLHSALLQGIIRIKGIDELMRDSMRIDPVCQGGYDAHSININQALRCTRL